MSKNSNVIYDDRIPKLTEPPQKRKTNKLFLLLVVFFFIFILCLLYFQSPYSKLSSIEIKGQKIVQKADILKQAELEVGMSFYNFRVSKIEEKLAQLIEIKELRVNRVFPNKLTIEITEHPYTSFWLENDQLYPVLSTGHILLHRPWTNGRVDKPILSNWPNKEGLIELNAELSKLPTAVLVRISEITLTPIISDPYRLKVFMTDGFEVRTTIRKFAENLSYYPHYVEQLVTEGKKEGIIHLFEGKWYEQPSKEDGTEESNDEAKEE